MPQPVPSRVRSDRGALQLQGAARVTLRAGALALRRVLRRALHSAVLAGALGCALPAMAQQGGQIYIAGPGDHSGADAARMNAMLQAPANAQPAAVVPAAPAAPAVAEPMNAASGMITIPGPGERTAGNAGASAPQIVTIPAPVQRNVPPANEAFAARYAQSAFAASGASRRASVGVAASRVAPVVVGAEPAMPAGAHAVAPGTAVNAVSTAQTAAQAAAQPVPPGQQDGEAVRRAATAFLQQQSAGLPGHVNITVSPVFPHGLAACEALEPFLPTGARSWGHTTIGVRCIGDHPWTLYVQARVAVDVTYYTAARPIGPGETLSVADLLPRTGDLASLPQTVITDASQALGAVSLARISAGLPLRTDMLRSAASVVIGQTVKLVANGESFSISTEGSVLNNAAPGQRVQVRTSSGQIVTGVVKDAGTVEVQI